MKIFTLVFCCLIAVVAFWSGIKLIKLYLKVKKWNRVWATVTRKSVVKRVRSSASRAGFKPAVEYSYKVNLKEYSGNNIFLVELINGERGFLYKAAEKFLEKIKPEIEIYVNPEKPEESVIFFNVIAFYIFVLTLNCKKLTSLYLF